MRPCQSMTRSFPGGGSENSALTGLPAGDYYVKSSAANYMGEYYNDVLDPSQATLVRVQAGETIAEVNFKLSPMYYMFLKQGAADSRNYSGAMVYGRILDASGQAVADAMVYLLDENGLAVNYTNSSADGSYQLAGMNAGNYTLQAVKMGFSATFNGNVGSNAQAKPVNVGNGTAQIDLVMLEQNATGIKPSAGAQLPESVVLHGNYPNPFNPSTRIRFSLPQEGEVTLTIFNLAGKEVAKLVRGRLAAGSHTIEWNGQANASGVYLYRLQAGADLRMGKMLMLK